jgi:phosphoglycolate phosphatase
MVGGVIFDLDGTLAHTLPDIADAINAGLRGLGLPPRPESDVRDWIGEGMPKLCQRALAGRDDVPLDEMAAAVTAYYREHRLDKVQPFDGVPEVLDELTRRRIPVSVLSNKPYEHIAPMMEALFNQWSWVAVEGYREENRRKPDPRTALDIAERMNMHPSKVLMVGDSFTDVETAINAGMVPVGCTWGYRSRQELIDAGAKYLIDQPGDLIGMMDTLSSW